MNNEDKKSIIERYNKRLEKHGDSIEALASGTAERRNIRFEILTNAGIRNGDSVLDLGCGFGDLYQFFVNKSLAVNYVGIDINPDLINIAKKRYLGVDFRVKDIQVDEIESFDWVVSTSSFNLKLHNEDNYLFVEPLLKRCLSLAHKGVAVDFLSSYVDFFGDLEAAFYYSPEKLLSIAKSITNRVCIRHDYPLFEFCVYLYPPFVGWGKKC